MRRSFTCERGESRSEGRGNGGERGGSSGERGVRGQNREGGDWEQRERDMARECDGRQWNL